MKSNKKNEEVCGFTEKRNSPILILSKKEHELAETADPAKNQRKGEILWVIRKLQNRKKASQMH